MPALELTRPTPNDPALRAVIKLAKKARQTVEIRTSSTLALAGREHLAVSALIATT